MVAANNFQFERLWAEIHELRIEMRDMRGDMHAGFDGIRRDMFRGAVALFGVLSAQFAVLLALAI